MPLNETTAAGAQRGLHAYADFGPHDLAGGVIVSGPSSGASDSRTEAAAPSAATDFGYSTSSDARHLSQAGSWTSEIRPLPPTG